MNSEDFQDYDINPSDYTILDRIGENTESQKFNEWEGKKKINFKQTEELNEIFTEYGYGRPTKKYPLTSSNSYNEFTLNMGKWEERYNAKRLTRILSDKSKFQNLNNGMTKMNNFKYFTLSNIENFRGATVNFPDLKKKSSSGMKIEVNPKELNFHSIELCSPIYKNLTLKNLDKQKNIEIASIISESSQIKIDHNLQKNRIIRPGKKINIRVTVTAELKEPINTVIAFTLKNGSKLLYLVKFIGIDNYYGFEPLVIDKARSSSTMINFILNNQAGEDFEFILSDIKVQKESIPVQLYHASMKLSDNPGELCDNSPSNPHCYQKLSSSKFKIASHKRKAIFKMNLEETEKDFEEFVVHFIFKDIILNEKKLFRVPVYIFFNNNTVDLYPPILDFGVVYANSGIKHKISVRAIPDENEGIRVGFPFVPTHSDFKYDFSPLVKTHGVANSENTFLVGTVTLMTQGLKNGNHEGYIIFCQNKVCNNGEGMSRLYYRFTVHRDPLNGVSKMHSFEITPQNTRNKRKSFHIQMLWLKNTFEYPLKIDDIT